MSKKDDTIEFRALQLANEHRNAYGLRYSDYNRYRNHCGNRTHRLRHTLKMTHGKGREFKKLPPVTLDNIKSGHLQLLLFEAERAWAYSQELYTSSLQPANEANAGKLRHSATSRFRRAVHWATQLLSQCQTLYQAQRFSAENLVEATAYALILSGRFLRYRDDNEDALDQLCVARDLLDNLASCAVTSRDQALAVLFADEISPEIRYCAHQLGHAKSYDVDGIVKEISPKNRETLVQGFSGITSRLKYESASRRDIEGSNKLKELIWEEKPVPVRNPELVDVLLRVQTAEEKLTAEDNHAEKQPAKGKGAKQHKSRKGVAAFDSVLAALSDAEEVARKLVEAQQASGGPSTRSGARDIPFLHSYITYRLLSRRIERDLALVSALVNASSKHPKTDSKESSKNEKLDARVNPAVVKILDTVLQSLTHMRSLDIVDESPDLANAVDARIAFTKSRRCLFLSRSYSAVKQYVEAIALTQRASLYIREALSLLLDDSDPINSEQSSFYVLTQEHASDLQKTIQSEEELLKQDWFAYNGGSVSHDKDTSKKPLFFDIALNYVQLDMDKLQERAGIKPVAPVAVKSTPAELKPVAAKSTKVEEIERAATPEPSAPARGTLQNLLGGWWGRK